MDSLTGAMWSETGFVACDAVPLSDRGFRYGMSVFESVRVEANGPQFLEAHLERLQMACAARELPLAGGLLERAGEWLETHGAAAVEPGVTEGFARIYVTAGDGAPTAPARLCRAYIFIEARPRPTLEAYAVTISNQTYVAPFGGLKTANYWVNLDILQRARHHSCDEALLFNERAELVSACMANVFVVHGGRVRTPALHCGARDGVMREWVMNQVPVEEAVLSAEEVRAADEIFLTNSWIGVMPVASCDGRVLLG